MTAFGSSSIVSTFNVFVTTIATVSIVTLMYTPPISQFLLVLLLNLERRRSALCVCVRVHTAVPRPLDFWTFHRSLFFPLLSVGVEHRFSKTCPLFHSLTIENALTSEASRAGAAIAQQMTWPDGSKSKTGETVLSILVSKGQKESVAHPHSVAMLKFMWEAFAKKLFLFDFVHFLLMFMASRHETLPARLLSSRPADSANTAREFTPGDCRFW